MSHGNWLVNVYCYSSLGLVSTVQINSGTSVFLKRGHIVRFTSELAIFQAFLYIVTLSTPDVSGAASHNLTE